MYSKCCKKENSNFLNSKFQIFERKYGFRIFIEVGLKRKIPNPNSKLEFGISIL
jgi:hypothetical protein